MHNLLYDKWYLGRELANCLDDNILNYIFKNYTTKIEDHILSFELEKKFNTNHSVWKSNMGLKNIEFNKIQYGENDNWIYPIEPWGHLMYSLNVEAKDDYSNFFEKIPNQIIEDVNNNKGKIVINYSHEGWVNDWLLKGFYLGAKNKKINFKNIFIILNDYNLKTKLENFKIKYDIENYPNIINYSFFLTASSKHFFEKYKDDKLKVNHKSNKKYKFLFLNRRLDLHRVKLMCEIYNTIKENSLISFDKNLITDRVIEFLNSNNLNEKFDNLPNKIIADREDILNTNGYQHENKNLYLDSFISIVTETSFYNDNDFISEKIWKPLYQFHPIIIVGRPHLLKYLKDIGFKTFDWLINEEYDNIEDNDKRMQYIIFEIEKLNKLSLDQIKNKIFDNYECLEHNHNLLNTLGKKTNTIEKFILDNIQNSKINYLDIFKSIKID